MRLYFPHNFLWGSSISSYQTEGENIYSDWFLWEKERGLERAGASANHYKFFKEDIEIAFSLSHNAFRFSLEWSRIYPHKDNFNEASLKHYKDVIDTLRKYNITPVVTLHHFTNPIWYAKEGGWLNHKLIDYFLCYVKKVVSLLKDNVEYWIIFNEPVVYVYNGFLKGIWPPGIESTKEALRALRNILKAYILSYQEIKSIYADKKSFLSIAKNMRVFIPCSYLNFGQNNLFSFIRSRFFNFYVLDYLHKNKCLDFIGLNYYCSEFTKADFSLWGRECTGAHHKLKRNDLGWWVFPFGLYELLVKLKKYNLPIIITENGTVASLDEEYASFMISHIESVVKAINDGVDVRGYLWWSLLDNFEWDKGYSCRFGLVDVDFNNFSRKIKPFALKYRDICRNNCIDIEEKDAD